MADKFDNDRYCHNFRHLLQWAFWWIMQCRSMASSTPSSSSFLWISATSPFLLPVIDGAQSIVIPGNLFHGKSASTMESHSWRNISWAIVWAMHWNHCEQLLHHLKIVINATDMHCELSVMSLLSSRATEFARKCLVFSRSRSYMLPDRSEMYSAIVLAERLMLSNWPFFSGRTIFAVFSFLGVTPESGFNLVTNAAFAWVYSWIIHSFEVAWLISNSLLYGNS